MIDPTCGSGHFLLGAFDRLLDRWHKHAPAMEIQARVQSALDAIHGVDLNPFAVAIARFRLTVAALQACDLRSLEDAPAFKYHLAVGDSLIHGPDSNVLPGMEERGAFMPFHYATEDAQLLLELLEEGRYDAVVGNPPYITVKDKALNKIYRSKFGKVCKGTYALTVPFMVQFFALAKRGEQSGWVGHDHRQLRSWTASSARRSSRTSCRPETSAWSRTPRAPISRTTARRRSSSSAGTSRRSATRFARSLACAANPARRIIPRKDMSGHRSSTMWTTWAGTMSGLASRTSTASFSLRIRGPFAVAARSSCCRRSKQRVNSSLGEKCRHRQDA